MYCQNCGEKIEEDVNICPFCGYSGMIVTNVNNKDRTIQELQDKIAKLEQEISNNTIQDTDQKYNNKMMFIVMLVLPIAFLIFFFMLVFMLINR